MGRKNISVVGKSAGEEKLQWHPAFSAAIQIELKEDAEQLTFSIEYPLTRKPLVVDVLICKKAEHYICKNGIACFFQGHNIIEYKNPEDSYGIQDFYKTMEYAGIYQSNMTEETSIRPEDITVTVVCGRYPRKVFQMLKKQYGMIFLPCEKGIYRSEKNILFPIQFVVNTRLDTEEYIWLGRLKKNLTIKDDVEILAKEYNGKKKNPLCETVMDVIMRANKDVYKEAKHMCNALRELFADELEERENKGIRKGIGLDILELLADYGEVPEHLKTQIEKEESMEVLKSWLKLAARATGIEDFERKMKSKL